MKSKLNIFISYSSKDKERFHIIDLKRHLETFPEINHAFFWETDVEDDIYAYMEKYVPLSDIMVVMCSPNYSKSNPCQKEWQIGSRLNKQIIPVFVSENHIPRLLLNNVGVEIDLFANPEDNIIKIGQEVVRRINLLQNPDKINNSLSINSQNVPNPINNDDILLKKYNFFIEEGNELVTRKEFHNALRSYNNAMNATRELFDTKLRRKTSELIDKTKNEQRQYNKMQELLIKGEIAFNKGEFEKYIKFFDQSRDLCEKYGWQDGIQYVNKMNEKSLNASGYISLGYAFSNLKRYDEALKNYKKAIKIDPNNTIAYSNLGNTFNDLKKYDEAIKNCEKAIEIDPNNAYAYNNLGNAFNNLKKYDEAIEKYEKAIQIDPNYSYAYSNLGNTFNELKSYDKSIKNCERAIKIDPNNVYAYYNLGITLSNLKMYDKAIENYEKAIEIDPKYTSAYNNLGNTLNELNRFDEAIKSYEKAIKIDPNNAVVYYNLANAFKNIKKYGEAIKNYEKVIEINPNNANIYIDLGNAFNYLKMYDEAIKKYTKAIEIGSNSAIAYSNLGAAFINLKRYDEAIKNCEKAIEIDSSTATAYYNLGCVYSLLNSLEKSIENLSHAIKLDVQNKELAKTDHDFDNIRQIPKFQELIR